MKRALSIVAAIGLFAFVLAIRPLPANAGDPTEQLKGTIDSILLILQDANLKGHENRTPRRAALSKTVSIRFSFKEMSKRSLGKNWKGRTTTEKKEFTSVFKDLIQNSYFTKMETYTDEKIIYDKERTKGRTSIIKTIVITKTATEIPIDYRMKLNKKGEWMVYDIVVEGISLVSNYRSSFASELKKGSFGDLIASLKKKTAQHK